MPLVLAILLTALHVADARLTWLGLRRGAKEGNPVAHWLFKRLGVTAVLIGKVALGASLSAALYWLSETTALAHWLLVALCFLYAAVVVNNWRIVRRRMSLTTPGAA